MPYSQMFKHKMIQKMTDPDAISDTLSTAASRWRCCLHCRPMVTSAAQPDDYQQFAVFQMAADF